MKSPGSATITNRRAGIQDLTQNEHKKEGKQMDQMSSSEVFKLLNRDNEDDKALNKMQCEKTQSREPQKVRKASTKAL